MPTPHIFLALAHAPVQLDGMLTYAGSLRKASELGPRLRELIILAIANARDRDYIALHHEADALSAGFTAQQVSTLRGPHPDSELFSEVERAVLAMGRAIGENRDVTQEEWEAAARHLTDQQLVQLVMTAAWYAAGTMLTRLLRLDLEDEHTEDMEEKGMAT